METVLEITTYCGLDCNNCEYKEKYNCGGCKATCGKAFYGECSLAKCAIEHEIEHCGLCDSFPCKLLNSYSYDEEYGDNGKRIEALRQLIENSNIGR